jgi:uncharacterized membrane protein YeaQ/YmgE (transglycosylase-associated protein family)
MKLFIFLGLTIGGLLGGWLGSVLDHGNGLGGWSILLSTIGSLVGIWVGYKAARNWLG